MDLLVNDKIMGSNKPPKNLTAILQQRDKVTGSNNNIPAFIMKWAPFIIILLTAIVYSKAIFNEFSIFDDDFFIRTNPLVKDLSADGLRKILTSINSGKYQPLTTLSFAIEYRLLGFNPILFHFTNILLHLISTLLAFKFTERLSGNRITAIIVAFLFALHPMHVEEVAWASERKDMLYAVFYLWSLLVYLKYRESGFKRKYYVTGILIFLASLLSKSEAITLPLVLVAIDLYNGRTMKAGVLLEKIPYVVFSVIIFAISLVSKNTDGGLGEVSVASYGFVNRVFFFTSVPAFYIAKLIAPVNLSAMHYYPDMHGGLIPWFYYASLPFTAGIVWFFVKLPSFYKANRAFIKQQVLFGISFLVLTIFVMPQLVFVGPSLTPERYTYIPYIGLFFIIGQCITAIAIPAKKKIVFLVLGAFGFTFMVLTFMRIGIWQNDEALLGDILDKNSDVADCSYFYWLRGNKRLERQDMPGAIQDYTTAIQQHHGYIEAYSNRGGAYFKSGDVPSAIRDYDSSLHYSPNHAMSYYNRGAGKATIGDFAGALTDYTRFLQYRPNDPNAYGDRGMVRLALKDSGGACEDWKKAVSLGNGTVTQFLQQICK